MTDTSRLAAMESERYDREVAIERAAMMDFYLDNISKQPSQNAAAEWLWELKNDRDHYRSECQRLRMQVDAAIRLYRQEIDQ